MRLKKKLESHFDDKVSFKAPENWEEVEILIDKKINI